MLNRDYIIGRAFLVVGIAAVLYALVTVWTGWDKLSVPLSTFRPLYVLPLLALSLVNYSLRFWRWECYLRHLGVRLPLRRSLLLFLSAFVMVITPGKLGEAFKAGLLSERYRVPLSVGLPVVLAERLFDFLGIFALACVGLVFWRGSLFGLGTGLVVAAAIPLCLLLFRSAAFHRWLLRRAAGSRQLDRFQLRLAEALDAMRRLLGARIGALSLLLSVVAWFAECCSLWLSCRACGVPIPLPDSCFVYGAGTLVGSLSFLPGGLGGTEATLIWLLRDIGLETSAATAAALIVRLAPLWLAVLIGMCLLPVARRYFTAPVEPDRSVSSAAGDPSRR